jgi:hypothetical protein
MDCESESRVREKVLLSLALYMLEKNLSPIVKGDGMERESGSR